MRVGGARSRTYTLTYRSGKKINKKKKNKRKDHKIQAKMGCMLHVSLKKD